MTITTEQLQHIMLQAKAANIATYLPFLNQQLPVFHINTPERLSAFIAQTGHESGQFSVVQENLNYKADRLLKVFPKYFPSLAVAQQFAGKPDAIANRVYADRMGNGIANTGDGWRFKGRGLIQLTGRNSYGSCSLALTGDKNTFLDDPDLLATPEFAVKSACWFWTIAKNLNEVADKPDNWTVTSKGKTYSKFQWITRTINGGLNGFDERKAFWDRAKSVFEPVSS